MTNKKLSFAIDASQIDIKPILKKEFLELRMKAISSANPNRNNSYFTKKSMEKSIESFRNKPILGYFENGDFVSHNGEWQNDEETQMEYWDTYGKKGERILGLIRSDDELKIIEDENGLSWICLSCALWVQYNFKQVKRLLKDAKRAKTEGGPTKNISVEVDITDYEMLDNGVMQINEFNLIGITILGSRNGVKVEPGIEDAELSVVDIMGKELYEKQANSVRLAYERLNDGSDDKNKEEFSKMDKENAAVVTEEENIENNTSVTPEEHSQETFETDTKDTESESKIEEKNLEDFADKKCDDDKGDEDDDEDKDDDGKADDDDKGEDKVCEKCGKNPCGCEKQCENKQCEDKHENESCDCECPCEEENKEKTKEDTIRDLAWLVSDMTWNVAKFEEAIKYYEEHEEAIGKNYILPIIRRMRNQSVDNEQELAFALAKIVAENYEDNYDDDMYEEQISQNYDCKKLYNEICDLKKSLSEKEAKIIAYEKAEFLKSARDLINSVNLEKTVADSFYSKCENDEIKTIEDLKTAVALYCFDNKMKEETQIENTSTSVETFEAPVSTIDTTTVFNKETKNTKVDKWTSLHNYVNEK